MSSREAYRTEEELEYWKKRDPLIIHKERLISQEIATETEIVQMEEAVYAQIAEALEFAQQSPYPDPEEVFDDLLHQPHPYRPGVTPKAGDPKGGHHGRNYLWPRH